MGGEDCQLSGCEGAYACEGAQVTLRRCATRDCVSCGYSVDDRSVLTLHNCTSTGDDVGFFCLGHLHAQDCELRRFCTGADVISEQGIGGVTCKLVRCRFVDPKCTATEGGLSVDHSGVLVRGKGAQVRMHECTVSGTGGHCVWVTRQAKATLEGCQLSHSRTDCVRCAEGSELTLDGCNVSKNDGNGVYCHQEGRVFARRVHSCGNKQAGFAVFGNGSMTLNGCSSDRDGMGCLAYGAPTPEVQGTAHVALSGVLVRRSSGDGFLFDSDAKGCMKHCVALQCGDCGMLVEASEPGGPKSSGTAPRLSVCDSTFQRCSDGGVAVEWRCAVSMQNVLCSRYGDCAFDCLGAGSRLALTRCEVEGSGEPYRCEDGGQLHCAECRPAGPCIQD